MNTLDQKMQEQVCFVGFTRGGTEWLSSRVQSFGEAKHFIIYNCNPADRDIRIFYYIAEDMEVVIARLNLSVDVEITQ
ncbi:putative transcriptional regulator [Pseudomonas phage vB_PaeP_PS28]|nr:putative transcriptional regulator [Pseudomonas phage vB_PaeP_PS28]